MLHAGSNNESMGSWAYIHLWGCKYQWQESRWTEGSKLYCSDCHIPTFRAVEPTVTSLCPQKPGGVTRSGSQNLARPHPLCHFWISLFSISLSSFLSFLICLFISLIEVWFSWLSLNPFQCYSNSLAKKASKRTLNNLMLVCISVW